MKTLLAVLALTLGLPLQAQSATAVFGGGCFWCIESDCEKLDGVGEVVSGYSGGAEKNPTYEQVSDHRTGHIEVVRVSYDPSRLSYAALLDYYFHHVDPLTANGQFCDRGPQYRSAIFYDGPAEKAAAEAAIAKFEKQLGRQIVTELLPAQAFWPAEDYPQDYARKNPLRYRYYRTSCGRDARVKEVWGKAGR